MTQAHSDGVRLQKVLAQAGVASRRAAEELIAAGRVEEGFAVLEDLLDLEAIHSMAPDAKLVYVAAKTPSDSFFYDAFMQPHAESLNQLSQSLHGVLQGLPGDLQEETLLRIERSRLPRRRSRRSAY